MSFEVRLSWTGVDAASSHGSLSEKGHEQREMPEGARGHPGHQHPPQARAVSFPLLAGNWPRPRKGKDRPKRGRPPQLGGGRLQRQRKLHRRLVVGSHTPRDLGPPPGS